VLVGDPTAYKGASVDFVGRVLAAPEVHAQGVVMQVWEDPKNFANNTIVGYKQPGFQVAQNDYVHVVGTVTGVYTGKNAFGAAVTAPVAVADSVQVVNAIAAAPPAIATRGSRTQIQALIGVLISKVEFAASETRVFMGVINGSKSTVSILASTMAAVQAGQQFDATFSTDYPQVSSELVSGARTSGVVVFPAMNPSGDLKLILQVNSQDTTVGTYGQLTYTFSWGGRR
jgi:hypothetical protein